jgi:hypothetical protein
VQVLRQLRRGPRRHAHVVDDQFEPGATLGDLADSWQEERGGERHRHAGPLGREL